MIRTQIYITKTEHQKLQMLANNLETSQSSLIREAIDQFLAHKLKQSSDRKSILKSAKGLWANRTDLPDFKTTRKSLDRDIFE